MVAYPPYLKHTVRSALIVASILFVINRLGEVIAGRATAVTCLRIITLFVPYCVSTLGVLVASRCPS
ncbi:MAG TPA: nitrate/nitrite transporter NrtS [Terriglobia bacterium]|nr:nitrate/nitrite transporter NrtS [Terriglobia bacterium]